MSEQETPMEDVSIPSPDFQGESGKDVMRTAGGGLGAIHCDKSVFKKIAARAASKVDGVATIGGRSTLGGIFREKDSGIEVSTSDDSFGIHVSVYVTVFFDFNIYEVCTELQRSIINDIEADTNYSVEAVDIKVQDVEAHVEQAQEGEPQAEEGAAE